MNCRIVKKLSAAALMLAGCGETPLSDENDTGGISTDTTGGPGGGGGGGDGGGGGGTASVWLVSNSKQYTVTDGVAGDVYYESNVTSISYTDDKHFEEEFSYTYRYNTYNYYDTYTYSVVGSRQASYSLSQNGNTLQMVDHTITDYTTTLDYVDPAREDGITRTQSNLTTTYTATSDEESGLTLSTVSTQTGTSNGEPVNSSSETRYTLVPLSTSGDAKTYKYYTGTVDTGAYSVYTVQNGITLEIKSYTADRVLSATITYTITDNATIRQKLPRFTVTSVTYETTPANNSYQTCEILSDSATELTIRVKTYTTAGVLSGQTDTTYKKR